MNDLKQKTLTLIAGLLISEEIKASLQKELSENGVTQELLENIEFAINQSEKEFVLNSEKKIKEFRAKLAKAKQEIDEQRHAIQKEADAKSLEEIRKKLKS